MGYSELASLKNSSTNLSLFDEYLNYYYNENDLIKGQDIVNRKIELSYGLTFYYFPANTTTFTNDNRISLKIQETVTCFEDLPLKTYLIKTDAKRFQQDLKIESVTSAKGDYTDTVLKIKSFVNDIGAIKGENSGYNFNKQNLYDENYNNDLKKTAIKQITRIVSVNFEKNEIYNSTEIYDLRSKLIDSNLFFNTEYLNETIVLKSSESYLGVFTVTITFIIQDGIYGRTISKSISATVNTASPTIYKRPFSMGINQYPSDDEVLRIEIPENAKNKKYVLFGQYLVLNLEDGYFYRRTDTINTSPPTNSNYIGIPIVSRSDTEVDKPYRKKITGVKTYRYYQKINM